MPGTIVFIPAWNEEGSLPGVLAEARSSLPDADLLVVDDGSTDGTADAAREGGAEVVSFGENRGLREGIAEGYRQALDRGYDFCGRLDADGQHPAAELARMLELVRADECDVAIGSRFLPDSGEDGERYKPTPERVFGTSLLRLLMRLRLGQRISDGTSGMYAVNRSALALLADPYVCEAPGGRGARAHHRREAAAARGAGAHAPARARRVVVPRPAGGRARRHDRPDAVRGRAHAPPPSAPPAEGPREGPAMARLTATDSSASAAVPAACLLRPT